MCLKGSHSEVLTSNLVDPASRHICAGKGSPASLRAIRCSRQRYEPSPHCVSQRQRDLPADRSAIRCSRQKMSHRRLRVAKTARPWQSGHPFQMAMPGMERKPADRFERSDAAGREMSHRRIACRKDSATLAGPDILSRWQCLGWKGSRQIASSDQMQPAER